MKTSALDLQAGSHDHAYHLEKLLETLKPDHDAEMKILLDCKD